MFIELLQWISMILVYELIWTSSSSFQVLTCTDNNVLAENCSIERYNTVFSKETTVALTYPKNTLMTFKLFLNVAFTIAGL